MSFYLLAIWIVVSGAVGGVLNALTSDNGFLLPRREKTTSGVVVRPGFVGNVVVGAFAAGLSWALYGPLSDSVVIGGPDPVAKASVTLAVLGGAALVGFAGARWLNAEIDKKLAQELAARTARAPELEAEVADRIGRASPAQGLAILEERTGITEGAARHYKL